MDAATEQQLQGLTCRAYLRPDSRFVQSEVRDARGRRHRRATGLLPEQVAQIREFQQAHARHVARQLAAELFSPAPQKAGGAAVSLHGGAPAELFPEIARA